jgi:hypothetical protein
MIFEQTGSESNLISALMLLNRAKFNFFSFYRHVLLALFACLGSCVPLPSAVACDPAPTNIVGWWPGDGNANDIIGTNNGTLLGGATATNVGMVAQCFRFNGITNYVEITNSSVLEPSTLTVECWVKFTSLNNASQTANAGHQYIVFKQNTVSGIYQNFGIAYGLGKDRYPNVTTFTNGDGFYFNVMDSKGNYPEVDATNVIATNVWYHLAGVRGSNYIQLYVNGQFQGQVAAPNAQYYNGHWPVYFGTTGESYWDGKLNGMLDEVSFYNRPLSNNEIAAIYNAGAGGKCKGTSTGGNPPAITNQPVSIGVIVSNTASFTVGVSGDPTLNYQWWFNATNAVGLNTNVLTLNNVTGTNAGNYSVVITNVSGSATSAPALLTVKYPPAITNQPASLAVIVGSNASFTVGVSGDVPLSYQWYFNGTNAIGLNTNVLALANVTGTNAGSYSVVVTNNSGSVTSAPALLTVAYPPVITNQPASLAVIVGSNASFTVGVSGDAPLSYQWYFNGTNAIGLNTNVLTLVNVQETNAGNYSVLVANVSGSVTSSPALLTVYVPPTITLQPQSVTNLAGATTGFSVMANGNPSPSYQWQLDSTNISGATTDTLTLTNVQPAQAGNYTVIVTNLAGAVTSSNAALFVIVISPVITVGSDVLNNTFGLSFPTQNGLGYHLEYKNDLGSTNDWQELTNVLGDGNPATLNVPTDAPTMRYFRLRVQ